MANILYITESASPSASDDNFISFLESNGNTVDTLVYSAYATGGDTNYDFSWTSHELKVSRLAGNDLLNSLKPIIYVPGANSIELGFSASQGQTAVDEDSFTVADTNNPLSAGLPNGDTVFFSPLAPKIKSYRPGNYAASANVAFHHTTGFGDEACALYINQGDLLYDGVTTAPGLRINALGGVTTLITAYNANGVAHLLACVALASGQAASPKLVGTLTPWDTQTPAANLTGIKYSVRSDLQTSDNQVLSGTTTTNASGQFTIEDAALSALTTYYVTFENAGGTVFATHKLTTE